MKAYGEEEVQHHIFLRLAVGGARWSLALNLGRTPLPPSDTHVVEGRADSRTGLDILEKRKRFACVEDGNAITRSHCTD